MMYSTKQRNTKSLIVARTFISTFWSTEMGYSIMVGSFRGLLFAFILLADPWADPAWK